jgi:DNA-binding PadR family transcriptional regulator
MGRSPSHHGLLILASLAAIPGDDERHGYAIKKDIERRTSNDVRLGSTTLYRLLAQLLDEGLIVERPQATPDADPRRRCYRITTAGRRALADELARLERVLTAARAVPGRRTP